MATNYQADIERVSGETLETLEAIATAAEAQLEDGHSTSASALASGNTFNSQEAVKTLGAIDGARRRRLESLVQAPAIARIVTRGDDGNLSIYYICRDTPDTGLSQGKRLAGRNSPAGRLASLSVGEDFEIRVPSGGISGEIVEKAILHPDRSKGAWDSIDSVLEGESYGPVTILSMREVGAIPVEDIADAVLAGILAEDERAANIIEGIRRNVITKMGLRDQPILDRYQDEIFRLPLNSQLLIIGPPGTGKTTTLIRRLGQKLDRAYLDDDERRLIDSDQGDGTLPHTDSWIMFTPTELLKSYLKEAFNRENIAAPDQRISTWTRLRLDLARNHFRILRTPNGGGPFVLRDDETFTQPGVLENQTAWFEDFADWQSDDFWTDLRSAAEVLAGAASAEARRLSQSLVRVLSGADENRLATTMVALSEESPAVEDILQDLKGETDRTVQRSLTLQVNRNRQFLEEFAAFLDGLGNAEEDDDLESDEEEESAPPRTRMAAAMTAYLRNLRSQARARFNRRTLGRTTRAGRIAGWIGDRGLSPDDLATVGESLQIQMALRRFTNPVRRYMSGLAGRYRRFRRARQAENIWYVSEGISAVDIDPLEVDVVLLCAMRAMTDLLGDRTIRRTISSPAYAAVRDYQGLVRNQVMVDEATDFSPIQLACMASLANPDTESFFACGDFNQRITPWGSRSADDMRWVMPAIEVRPIQVSYRHSRQLNQLAKDIVRLCSGGDVEAALPKDVNNEGMSPTLGIDLAERDDIIAWLAQRIIEIEQLMKPKPLPSVAILVNDEAEVGPLADGLKAALVGANLNVVACYKGQFAGQENDVRVFDVQYIKGLEFEAVFFLGVDSLSIKRPDLFDKFLYVGATRAANYLGLTCEGGDLPGKIAPLHDMFVANWQQA